jgi:putative transposase
VKPQPDDIAELRQSSFTHTLSPSNTKHAAIDIGANNTLTILTEDGNAAVYHARPEFNWFKQARERIDAEKSCLPPGEYSSTRIRGLYNRLYDRRDHHRDAAIKHAAD